MVSVFLPDPSFLVSTDSDNDYNPPYNFEWQVEEIQMFDTFYTVIHFLYVQKNDSIFIYNQFLVNEKVTDHEFVIKFEYLRLVFFNICVIAR